MIDNGSKKCKPIPLGVTFSNAVSSSKFKAQTHLFTETWQKRCSSFELWAFESDTPSGIYCTFISFMNCILSIVRFTVYWSVCVSWNRDVSVECWMMSAKVLCSLLTLYEWLRAQGFSRTHCVQVFKLTDSSVVLFAAPCTRHGQCWQRCMLASLVCEASSRPLWIDWPRVDCANSRQGRTGRNQSLVHDVCKTTLASTLGSSAAMLTMVKNVKTLTKSVAVPLLDNQNRTQAKQGAWKCGLPAGVIDGEKMTLQELKSLKRMPHTTLDGNHHNHRCE